MESNIIISQKYLTPINTKPFMEFIIYTRRWEHLNVRFVDVFYVLFRLSLSQHALRGLQYVIDKEKAWRETTTG